MCDDHDHGAIEVDLNRQVLAASNEVANRVRSTLAGRDILAVNLLSSPGSGKTTLLEKTFQAAPPWRAAVLEGDIATERDADRIRAQGVTARQILTGGACHLDARQIEHQVEHLAATPMDVLIIENVGNLVCPATYDLGEDFKVVCLSVTEGDDKPFKYPAIFAGSAVTVITKIDLLPHVPFDVDAVRRQVLTLRPDAAILLTSARTGEGIDTWIDLLTRHLDAKRQVVAGRAASGV
jgi:hydrogenase nickel incorporation protein HypB